MELMPAQMAHQRRLLSDSPAAFILFHEAEMLSTGGQHSGETLLHPLADLGRGDVGKSGRKVDARAPGVEWSEPRQTDQMLAVAVRGRAREPSAVAPRHRRHLSGCDKTGAEALDIPLERGRQRFVEIVDVEDRRAFGCC